MRLTQLLAAVLMAVFVAPANAEDKKPEKPKKDELLGTYTRDVGELKLSFTFKKQGMLTFKLAAGGETGISFSAKYTMDDKGKVKMTIDKVKKSDAVEDGPAAGDEYTFTVKRGKGTLLLSDLEGRGADQAGDIVEGEYKLADD